MNNRRARSRATWPELPQELLEDIARRLKSQPYCIRYFRAVCRSWRQSTPLSFLPITLPFLPVQVSLLKNTSYCPRLLPYKFHGETLTLVEFSVCLIRPSGSPTKLPWLATVEEVKPGKFYLRKPLSRTLVEQLPKKLPRNLDMSRFHLKEVSRGYYLRYASDVNDMFLEKELERDDITKVVLKVNPAKASSMNLNDYTAFLLCHDGTLRAVRLSRNITNVRNNFKPLSGRTREGMEYYINDVVNFKGEIYAIGESGSLYTFDYDSLDKKVIVKRTLRDLYHFKYKKNWLIELSGKLYSVCWLGRDDMVKIEFYEFNEIEQCWDKVSSLGDNRILFVTFDGCFTATVEDLPGWRGNTVLFYSGCFYAPNQKHSCPFKIFKHVHHWDDGKLDVDEYYFLDLGEDEKPNKKSRPLSLERYDIYAALLWPPPQWISTDAKAGNISVHRDDTRSGVVFKDSTTLSTKTFGSAAFEGLYIRDDLLPTLHKIQAKHGNIIGGCRVRNREILAKAFEELAVVVETIQSSFPRPLQGSQADYASSTFLDLQFLGLNVNWLAPYVKQALAPHQSD